jgi:ATP-binding protein involved in chromosome partitioning
VLENMSGYVCPQCGIHTDLFGTGGGERLSQEMNVPFLGRIPIDPRIVGCGDTGSCLMETFPESPAAQSYLLLADRLHGQEGLWSGALEATATSREAP